MVNESFARKCGRRCLVSMLSITFLDMIGIGIVIPTLAVMFLSSGSTILPAGYPVAGRLLLYGLLIGAYPLAQFFGAPILGALSDRHGRKRILLLSLAGTFIGYILFGSGILIGSLPLLFIGRIIDGLTGGNISVATSAIADISDERSKARNFGLIGMAFGFGFIIGPFLGGQLANPGLVSWFNASTPFWFSAGLTAMNMLLLVLIFPETSLTRVNARISLLTGVRNISRAFRMPDLRVMLLVVFLLTFGFTFFTQFFQVFLIERFHFTAPDIGNYFAFTGLWIAFTQGAITRPVSRRFAPARVLRVSVLMLGLSLPLLIFPDQAIFMYALTPLIAISQGLIFPNTTAIISNLSGRESQGEILGINQSLQSLAQAMPPLIGGLISSMGTSLPIIVASGFTLIAWGIFMMFFGRKKTGLFHEV